MKFDSIPEKRIIPPHEKESITKKKYEWMKHLLDGVFDEISPKERPTVLDFQGINPDSQEIDILKWIQREIGIEPQTIMGEKESKESKEFYIVINYAYQQAKEFLKNTLKYREEEVDIEPKFINSKNDLFNILKRTILMKGQTGLNKSLLYCRLVKGTLATYETLKHDAETLKHATEDFEKSLIASPNTMASKITPLILIKENEKRKQFYASSHGQLKGEVSFRGKDLEKAILKFIIRAESNAVTALKDGIATRIVVEKEQAVELIPIICEWLKKEKNVEKMHIENASYFSDEQIKKVEEILSKETQEGKCKISHAKANPTSLGGFEDVRILGRFKSLENAKENAIKKEMAEKKSKFFSLASFTPSARQFEIQFVEPDNKNEKGKRNHAVYDVVKLITARTRLDGGCPEEVFLEFVKDASKKSGINENRIIDYLTKKDEKGEAPVVKIRKQNGRKKEYYYATKAVYSRWRDFGWVDPDLYLEIEAQKK